MSDKEKWIKAGKIAREVLVFAKKEAKKGMLLIELAEKIEKKIKEKKAETAFPPSIACDRMADHYSPFSDDKTRAEGLLKIDLGVSVDGFLADTAGSVNLSKENKEKDNLIEASEKALQEAIKIAKPGTTLGEIGRIIEKTIQSHGFHPVRNLSGHGLELYQIHSGNSIPNYDNGNSAELKEGQIIAIEPFATNGEGLVKSGEPGGVYSLLEKKPIRDSQARKILQYIEKTYKTLPFCSRYITEKFGKSALLKLNLLEKQGCIKQYAQLVERSGGIVSHAEKTLLITKNGCEILT